MVLDELFEGEKLNENKVSQIQYPRLVEYSQGPQDWIKTRKKGENNYKGSYEFDGVNFKTTIKIS